ncbi:ER membrane protein complex subunit 10 [Aethina tumida]|uniref:ER membrane protein complex subunit 10 n=1 Tax=Aethina tumida TaxID=116153 RepID=UPI00096B309B|nr:ER membrane protein complex subunit 10 [Aethina tumida]
MLILNLVVAVLFSLFVSVISLEQDSSISIELLHSLTGIKQPQFTERGNITIHSLRSGQAIVDQKPLSHQEKLQLQTLADKNQFYQIKAIVTAADGVKQEFISTLKACMLAEAGLDERLSVSLDYTGRVVGITTLVASKSTCEGAVVPLSSLQKFNTHVYVRHTETGPMPDTNSYIQKLEREREAREKGETKDNRSFIAKYWMYIVPVLIVMLVSTAGANPEQGGN